MDRGLIWPVSFARVRRAGVGRLASLGQDPIPISAQERDHSTEACCQRSETRYDPCDTNAHRGNREKTMEMTRIADFARALYESHGNKAEAEAAQKARQFEEAGDNESAATWRAVREAINEMRAAPES